ncbi:MAG TPA: AraC family transcriptional regulator [Pseudonocardiaceae bacterium]|jgi:AraC-like DNA-binding protein|nr:AraC family transcriptional regulator [Pseudonocardiaceae bacterium]
MVSPFRHEDQLHMTDLDEARELVERSLCPHDLNLLHRNGRLDTWMWSYRMHDVSINDIAYGDDVAIVPGFLDSFFVAQVPLSGSSVIRSGKQETYAHPGSGSVPNPDDWLSMRWTADCATRVVRFERTALEAQLADMLGHPLHHGDLNFVLELDVSAGEGREFEEDLAVVTRRLERNPSAYGDGYLAHIQEQLLMTRLLRSARHNYRNELDAEPATAPSRVVRTAVDLMHNHANKRQTLPDLARTIGVSTRTLEREFREHTGVSPMTYYRGVRLDRVNQRLRLADPDVTTIGEIATSEGFLNRGRFAADYRRRHGESPSQTYQR